MDPPKEPNPNPYPAPIFPWHYGILDPGTDTNLENPPKNVCHKRHKPNHNPENCLPHNTTNLINSFNHNCSSAENNYSIMNPHCYCEILSENCDPNSCYNHNHGYNHSCCPHVEKARHSPCCQSQSQGANSTANEAQSAEEILKPQLDKREYRALTLKNQLRVLLVSDGETEKAAAALSVLGGFMLDPESIPGLAHFCEHMLFMGTNKYPEENSYQKFLSSNGGYCNAYTSEDSTVFYFDVSPTELDGALDRFAHFFIDPLFLENSSEREIQAVDSEYKKSIPNDSVRRAIADMSRVREGHPYGRFYCGNFETLWTIPREKSLNVVDELKKFHKENYSSNLMCLTVLGKESLDELQQIVSVKFEQIQNLDKVPPQWPESPYSPNELCTRIDLVPIMDIHNVLLIFPVKDYEEHYKTGMISYVEHLLSYKGAGSLTAFLKKKLWTTNGLGADYNRPAKGFAFFEVDIDLTSKGVEDVDLVVTCFFQYIEMLRRAGVQKWLWDEKKALHDMGFRFQEKESPLTCVESLTPLMQYVPTHDVLVRKYQLMSDYRPELIQEFINLINPLNFRLIVSAKKNAEIADTEEKWYGAKFKYSNIDANMIEKWKNCGVNQELKFPLPNPFIPTNFQLKPRDNLPKDSVSMTTPRIIRETEISRLWFLQDNEFNLPESSIVVSILSPMSSEDPASYNKSELLTRIVHDLISEFTAEARSARLSYKINSAMGGFSVSAGGFDEKCKALFEHVLTNFIHLSSTGPRYNDLLNEYIRDLQNWKDEEPYIHAVDYCVDILRCKNYHPQYLLEAIETQENDYEEHKILKFKDKILSSVKLEWFIHGNYTEQEALQIFLKCSKHFEDVRSKPLPLAELNKMRQGSREAILTPGWVNIYKAEHATHWNSSILFLIQCGIGGMRESLILELIEEAMNEPAFDILRTQEQLGYVVSTNVRISRGTIALRIIIQGEKDPEFLDDRIESFLYNFTETIKQMDEKRFEEIRKALLVVKSVKPKTLWDRGNMIFEEILRGTFNFQRLNLEISELQFITLKEVQNFYDDWIAPQAPKRKKLIVQVASVYSQENSSTNSNYDLVDPVKDYNATLKDDKEKVKDPFQVISFTGTPASVVNYNEHDNSFNETYPITNNEILPNNEREPSALVGRESDLSETVLQTNNSSGSSISLSGGEKVLVIPSSFENSPNGLDTPTKADAEAVGNTKLFASYDDEAETDLDSTVHTLDLDADALSPSLPSTGSSSADDEDSNSIGSQTTSSPSKRRKRSRSSNSSGKREQKRKLHWRPLKPIGAGYKSSSKNFRRSSTNTGFQHENGSQRHFNLRRYHNLENITPTSRQGPHPSLASQGRRGESARHSLSNDNDVAENQRVNLHQVTDEGQDETQSQGQVSNINDTLEQESFTIDSTVPGSTTMLSSSETVAMEEWVERLVAHAIRAAHRDPYLKAARMASGSADSTSSSGSSVDQILLAWVDEFVEEGINSFLALYPNLARFCAVYEPRLRERIYNKINETLSLESVNDDTIYPEQSEVPENEVESTEPAEPTLEDYEPANSSTISIISTEPVAKIDSTNTARNSVASRNNSTGGGENLKLLFNHSRERGSTSRPASTFGSAEGSKRNSTHEPERNSTQPQENSFAAPTDSPFSSPPRHSSTPKEGIPELPVDIPTPDTREDTNTGAKFNLISNSSPNPGTNTNPKPPIKPKVGGIKSYYPVPIKVSKAIPPTPLNKNKKIEQAPNLNRSDTRSPSPSPKPPRPIPISTRVKKPASKAPSKNKSVGTSKKSQTQTKPQPLAFKTPMSKLNVSPKRTNENKDPNREYGSASKSNSKSKLQTQLNTATSTTRQMKKPEQPKPLFSSTPIAKDEFDDNGFSILENIVKSLTPSQKQSKSKPQEESKSNKETKPLNKFITISKEPQKFPIHKQVKKPQESENPNHDILIAGKKRPPRIQNISQPAAVASAETKTKGKKASNADADAEVTQSMASIFTSGEDNSTFIEDSVAMITSLTRHPAKVNVFQEYSPIINTTNKNFQIDSKELRQAKSTERQGQSTMENPFESINREENSELDFSSISTRHINLIEDINKWKKALEYYPLPLPCLLPEQIHTSVSGSKDQDQDQNDLEENNEKDCDGNDLNYCHHHQNHCHHFTPQEYNPSCPVHCHGHVHSCQNNNKQPTVASITVGSCNDNANSNSKGQTIEWEFCPTTFCPHQKGSGGHCH